MTKIQEFAEEITTDIISRHRFDKNEIEVMIAVKLKSTIISIINDSISSLERNHLALLTEQSKHKIGSSKYIELGFKLAISKAKKGAANKAINELRRKEKIERENLQTIID
jgi:hypothetical protein